MNENKCPYCHETADECESVKLSEVAMLKKIIDYALGFAIAILLATLLMLLILLVTKVLMGDMNGL